MSTIDKNDLADFLGLDAAATGATQDAATLGGPPATSGSFSDDLFERGVIHQESRGRQFDANGKPLTSKAGAIGIAQVMPGTAPEAARMAGLEWDENRYRTDATYNKALGKAYFNAQLQEFGDPAIALAAYNAGPGATRRALKLAEQSGKPRQWLDFLPAETRDYVPKILGRMSGGDQPDAEAVKPRYADRPNQTEAAPRGAFSIANDFVIDAGNAAAGLVKAGVDLVAPDSAASEGIADFIKGGQDKQSDWKKDSRNQLQEALAAAGENDGSTSGRVGTQFAQAGAYLKHSFVNDPIGMVAEIVGNIGPFAVLGRSMKAAQLADGVRTAIASGVAGGLSAGEVRGNIWEEISSQSDADLMEISPAYAQLRKDGMDEAAAKSELGANLSRNLPEVAVVGLIGALSGKYGVEGMAAGVAPKYAGSRLASTAVGFVDEGVVQGGSEQVGSNVGVQRVIPGKDLMEGVGQNIAAEGLPGAGMGAAFGGQGAVAQSALKPSGPLSRAALAGGAPVDGGPAPVNPAAVTDKDEPATASEDPITARANAIEQKVRDDNLLEQLREIGQPDRTVPEFLDALTAARNPNMSPEVREQALESLEMAMGWIADGAMPSAPASGKPFSTELSVPGGEPATGTEVAQAGEPAFFDPDTVDVDAVRVDNMIGGPRAIEGPRDAQAADAAGEPQAAAGDAQEAPAAEGDTQAAAPLALATGRRQVPLPKVATPAGSTPAVQRQEAAQLSAAIDQGFDTVERRGDGAYLVNDVTNQEIKLSGLAAMQRARNILNAAVDSAANEAASSPLNDRKNPTEGQAKAGNYKRGRLKLKGLKLRIDNPRESTRSGKDADGKDWSTKMVHHYGDVEDTVGADGDPIDVFIGPRPDLSTVFVVDQINPRTGRFDEHKVMMGFPTIEAARAGYLANYDAGWQGLGDITEMPLGEFRQWVRSDATKRPAAGYSASSGKQGDADGQGRDGVLAAEGVSRGFGSVPGDAVPGDAAGAAQDGGRAGRAGQDVSGESTEGSTNADVVRDTVDQSQRAGRLGARNPANEQRLIQAFAERHGLDVRPADPSSDATQSLNALLDVMASLTGKRGIAVDMPPDADRAFDGVADEGEFFVNVNRPHVHVATTIAHEFKHLTERIPSFARVYDRIWEMIPDEGRRDYYTKYLAPSDPRLAPRYENAGPRGIHILKQEMVADFIGKRFNDRKWLEQLAQRKPALFGDFVRDWVRVLDEIAQRLRALVGLGGETERLKNVDRYITDIEQAKSLAMEAVELWATQYPRIAQERGYVGGEAMFSARDDDFTGFDDFDLGADFMDAEMQRMLQGELAAEAASESTAADADAIDPKALKAAGLMAEQAFGDLYWEQNGDEAWRQVARIPNLVAEGKTTKIEIEQNVDGLWRADMLGTWVGPAAAEADGFATEQGVKDFVARQVAAVALARSGFDLADALPKAQAAKALKAWKAVGKIEPGANANPVYRFGRADKRASTLKEIAAGMGITENYNLGVFIDQMDPETTLYNLTFTHKISGKSYSALLELHKKAGQKFFTANTIELGRSGMGAAVYQMAADFAARRGIPLRPESSLSGVNSYRRTEQMISAALRSGKSNAMVPHPTQRVYGFDDNAATDSAHNQNLTRLVLASLRNVRELAPEVEELIYFPETDAFTFLDGEDAKALVDEILSRTDARAFGLGRTQLARAALTQQFMQGEQPAGQDEFAANVLYSARLSEEVEYQAVVDQYKGTEQWLKAPNGLNTKLTQRQWAQVRTPSFKRWFGDWEKFATMEGGVWNDGNNEVSKVVDPETGEPLVVYHGTDKGGFMRFNGATGANRGKLGIFTTPNYEMASSYVRRGRKRDIALPTSRQDLEDIGFQFEELEDGKVQLVDTDGYVNDTYDSEADAVQAAIREFRGDTDVSTVYELFANLRNVTEEDFRGALFNGDYAGDNFEVFTSDGDFAYTEDGRDVMTRDEAEALAESIGGSFEEASPRGFTSDSVAREALSLKQDGAVLRNIIDDGGGAGGYYGDPTDVFVIFDSANVKSAEFNSGEFGDSDDIRFSLRAPNFTNPEDRLEASTAFPTAKKNRKTGYKPDAYAEYRVIDSKDITASKVHVKKVVDALKQYNGLLLSKTDSGALKELHDTVVENLLWLHDKVDPEARDRAKRWYDGANRIANEWAGIHGLQPRQASGILAVLSPQMDWFKNVSLGERVILTLKRHGNETWSPGMTAWAESWLAAAKTVDERTSRQPLVERMRQVAASKKPLSSLSNEDAALFVRAFDEAYYPREYRLVTPEGGFGDYVVNDNGALSSITWGGFGTIEKAVSIYRDGSFANISESLGGEHKVRNFYNNIIAPGSRDGHVTIDTHAVAAAFIKPLSGSDIEVKHNLGGLGSTAATGASGSYALYADAYRDAAARRGILAREMQSITWEAVRALFPAETKSGLKKSVNAVWDRYREGEISRAEARAEIFQLSGGINTFAWEAGGEGDSAASGAHSFNQAIATDPALREVRTLPAGRVRDQIRVSLSSATNSIPGIKSLYDAANKGDAMAAKLLQEIALDSLQHLLRGSSAKVQADFVTGLYGGSVEPAVGLTVKFDGADRQAVLAAIAQFADNFNQIDVHVRGETKDRLGTAYEDGSYVTPVYSWELKRALSRKEVQSIVDKSGLAGLTFGDGFIETYYVGEPGDEAKQSEFAAAATRVDELIGANGSANRRTTARLWPYGHGDGSIGYERIRGDVPAAEATFSRTARRVAEYLNAKAGVDGQIKAFDQADSVTPEQAALQREIAAIYEALPDNDLKNPRVRKAYAELAKEALRQFNALPVKVEVMEGKGEPYASSAAMRRDILDNNHLFVFATTPDTFGPEGEDFSGHPLLGDSGVMDAKGKPLLFNDLLRAVHDYYAHGMSATQFGPKGEEAAWKNHMAATANPWARWALTNETRGQNSWVNFRESLDPAIPVKDRPFARQKAALIPAHYALTGDRKIDAPMKEFIKGLPEQFRLGSKPVKAKAASAAPAKNLAGQDWNNDTRFSARVPGELFFSELSRQVEKAGMKQAAPGAWKQFIKALSGKGVKADEIEWTGVNDWLDLQTGKVAKDDVLTYLRGNGVQVNEVVLNGAEREPEMIGVDDDGEAIYDDGEPDGTKYSQYTLPGGTNYRELLLTLPAKDPLTKEERSKLEEAESKGGGAQNADDIREIRAKRFAALRGYKSDHWDQPNVLAHIRVDDRIDAEGARVLFVSELQSDWGQDGRRKGFAGSNPGLSAEQGKAIREHFDRLVESRPRIFSPTADINKMMAGMGTVEMQEAFSVAGLDPSAAEGLHPSSGTVPIAPFVTTTDGWLNLALRRVIGLATDEGYDKIAFINGDQSADLYDLSKQIDRIDYNQNPDGTYNLSAIKGRQELIAKEDLTIEEIEGLVGKDVAKKIANGEGGDAGVVDRWESEDGDPVEVRSLSGLDLKVGGQGMRTFYDSIVPNAVKALAKKFGGEITDVKLQVRDSVSGDQKFTYSTLTEAWGDNYVVDERTNKKVAGPFDTWQEASNWLQRNDPVLQSTQPGLVITQPLREKVGDGMPMFSARTNPQTNTAEFKKWFGEPGVDSTMVNEDGTPMRLFHGTTKAAARQIATFRRSNYGAMGPAVYLGDSREASAGYDDGAMLEVYARGKYLSNMEWTKYVNEHGWKGAEAAATADGYAGVYDSMFENAIAVWDPANIKSATGNNGGFDGGNPDIRFSARTNPNGAWSVDDSTWFDDFVFKAQDKLIDLKRVISSIRKTNGQISDDTDAYMQEELFHGRAAKQVEDFGRQELEPLMKAIADAGLTLADVEEYLHARHAEEANDVIAQRNPGDPGLQDGGSGMKTADARAYLAALSPDMQRKLASIAGRVDGIIGKTRQLYVDFGLEDQAVVDGWGTLFKHYIPLQREDKGGGMGIGQGFSVKGKETKGRTGSTRKVVDILANIAMQRERLIVRGEKNRVAQALVGLAWANPNADFWEVRSQAPTERVYDPKTNTVIDRPDGMFKNQPNVLTAKVKDSQGNVTEQAIVFNEDNPRAVRLAMAMKNIDAGKLEGLLSVGAKITRYFSSINTQYNPVFGAVNLIRDVQGALINLGGTPLADQRVRIATDTLKALSGIYGDIRKTRAGGHATSQWAALWEDFQQTGGKTGFRELFKTSKDRAEGLQEILTPDGWMDSGLGKVFTANGTLRVPMSQAKKGADWIFNWLSDYNEAMENGVRLAAYKAGLDQGMTKKQAASLAKNLTVNFNRRGQIGMQMGAVYAFFNAAMQGTARMGQVLVTMDEGNLKTMRLSKTGKQVVYGGIMLGSIQALMLALAGFDDEDPPEFMRERSLIIPTGGKTYISIPMPLGLHVIPGIGRHFTEFALSGFEKPAERVVSMVGMFADAFNPIGNAGLSMQTLAPTVLDPLVALTENKDWSGRPIARTSFNDAVPGHSLYKDTASTIAKLMAEGINTATGGNEYVAGALSPTPDQIDYLIGQVTGGVGRELSKVEQSALATLRGEDLPTYKIPLAGRFFGNAAGQASEGTAFYANSARLNELETEVKGLRADGKTEEANRLLASRPDAYLIAVANAAERQVQRLRKEKRRLIEAGASREAVKGVEVKITEAMSRLNRAAEKAEALER